MDRKLIEKYINSFDKKIVSVLDLDKCKIEYSGIKTGRDIRDSAFCNRIFMAYNKTLLLCNCTNVT